MRVPLRITTNTLLVLLGLILIGAASQFAVWFFDAHDQTLDSIVDTLPMFLRVPLWIVGALVTIVGWCGGLIMALLSFPASWMESGPVSDIIDNYERKRRRREQKLQQEDEEAQRIVDSYSADAWTHMENLRQTREDRP